MKKQVDKIDPVRSKFGKIEKEEVSLSDKMLYVEDFCKTHRKFQLPQPSGSAGEQGGSDCYFFGNIRADEGGKDFYLTGTHF